MENTRISNEDFFIFFKKTLYADKNQNNKTKQNLIFSSIITYERFIPFCFEL